MSKKKLIRITTIPISMNKILSGQLKYINTHYEVVGVSKYVEKDFNEIKEREGIRLIAIPFVRTINLWLDFICLFKLIFLFIKEKPQIVHTHTPKAGLLGMMASRIVNVPLRLHTVGGMPLMGVTGFKLKLLKSMEKLTYSFAHKVYPNSKGLLEFVLDNKFTTVDKLKVIGNGSSNGVDTEYFKSDYPGWETERDSLKQSLSITDQDFVFIFLGRLAKEKGINELLSAFTKLASTNNQVKLLLVGSLEKDNGPISNQDLQVINKSNNIIYPGRTDNIRAYLNLSHCFVFPSYREGFPNALLQAGAMGLPLIATNINGCNEIIEDGISGYLVPPKDVSALHSRMEAVLMNKSLRLFFAENSKKSIEDKFNQKFVWEALLSEYNSLYKQMLE